MACRSGLRVSMFSSLGRHINNPMYMPYGKPQVDRLCASSVCIKASGLRRLPQKPTHTKATSAQPLANCSHEGDFCAGFGALRVSEPPKMPVSYPFSQLALPCSLVAAASLALLPRYDVPATNRRGELHAQAGIR